MGPISLDLRAFLATAWRAVRRRPIATLQAGPTIAAANAPAVNEAASPEARWQQIESVLEESRTQIDRTARKQAEAGRQLDAATYALQGLLRDIDGVLATSARHRADDAANAVKTLATDSEFAASYRRARTLAA